MLRFLDALIVVCGLLLAIVPNVLFSAGRVEDGNLATNVLCLVFLVGLVVPLSIYSARTLNFTMATSRSAEYRASTLRLKRLVRGVQLVSIAALVAIVAAEAVDLAFPQQPNADIPLLLVLRVLEVAVAFAGLSMLVIKPAAQTGPTVPVRASVHAGDPATTGAREQQAAAAVVVPVLSRSGACCRAIPRSAVATADCRFVAFWGRRRFATRGCRSARRRQGSLSLIALRDVHALFALLCLGEDQDSPPAPGR